MAELKINNKVVKSISIEGKKVKLFTVSGKTFSFIVPITITDADMEAFVKTITTWPSKPTNELEISAGDYTAVTRSTPYANCIHLADYAWPATVETKDSVLLTFTDDVNAFYTSSDHFWISKADSFSADAIKVMSAPWPSQNFKAGETWLFSTAGVPVKVEIDATIDTTAKIKDLEVDWTIGKEVTSNYSIKASEYSTVNFSPGSNSYLIFNGWYTNVSGVYNVPAGQTLLVTFNNDIENFGQSSSVVLFRTDAAVVEGFRITQTNWIINPKAGETYQFESGKTPIKVEFSEPVTPTTKLQDGTKLQATVKFDANIVETINGKAEDAVFIDVPVVQ